MPKKTNYKKKKVKKTSLSKSAKNQLQKIVMARLNAMPSHIELAIGSKNYPVEELIELVRKRDELGEQLIEAQLEYLKDLSSGKIYGEELGDEKSSSNYAT